MAPHGEVFGAGEELRPHNKACGGAEARYYGRREGWGGTWVLHRGVPRPGIIPVSRSPAARRGKHDGTDLLSQRKSSGTTGDSRLRAPISPTLTVVPSELMAVVPPPPSLL